MSDLLLPLIILGVLIIAGVVVYNWLQEKKLRNQVSEDFIVPQKDVLADDFYIDADALVDKELAEITGKFKPTAPDNTVPADPFMDELIAVSDSNMQHNKSLDEPFISHENSFSAPVEAQANKPEELIVQATLREQIQNAPANLPDEIHPQVDLSAILYANESIHSQALIELNATLIDIGMPFFTHGLDADNHWQLINNNTEAASYKQAVCSVQLADRGGAIARQLLNKFQFAVESMGLDQNAHVEWQGSTEAMQRAADLDKFCIEVDQLISVHLVQAEASIHGTKLRGLAEANGMLLGGDGKFHFQTNASEPPVFYLLDSTNQPFTADNLRNKVLKSITFQIEIPKVNNSEQAFNQMISIAQKMSISLNASMVDDLQKPLGSLQIEKIRQQLKVIHATMVARGIMPGSPVSMRLFN